MFQTDIASEIKIMYFTISLFPESVPFMRQYKTYVKPDRPQMTT